MPQGGATMSITQQIDEAIALNEAANVEHITRGILDGLSDQLRRYRRILSKLQPEEAALYGGENWHGPLIADLIADSASFRAKAVPSEATRSRLYSSLIGGEHLEAAE
jgi:hypothetical protein